MKKYFLFIFLAAFAKNVTAQQIEGTLLAHWNDTTLLANNNGGTYNEIWGFVSNGHEYAVLGSTNGLVATRLSRYASTYTFTSGIIWTESF